MTKILWCACVHDYQDARYGAHLRVHNAYPIKGTGVGWRCTVCKTERAK